MLSHMDTTTDKDTTISHLPDGEPDRVVGEPSELTAPIFIAGCYRSGTSMLRQILDAHPRISSGAEDPSLYSIAQTDTEMLARTLSHCGYPAEQWYSNVRHLVEDVHRRYAESQGKTRWALKAPENSYIIPYLDKLYPDCQVVHIVRHPRDVIASNRKKFGTNNTAFYGGRWVAMVRAAEKGGAGLGAGRFRTIKYEDLVRDPETQLAGLLEWLGEPWDERVLRPDERTHRFPARVKANGKVRPITADSIGKGSGYVKDDVRSLLYVRLKGGDLLQRFGYQIRIFGDRPAD